MENIIGIIIAFAVVGGFFQILRKINRNDEAKLESKRRAKEEVRRKQQEVKEAEERIQCRKRHEDEQEGQRNQMIVLGNNSITLFESMPKHLVAAEGNLDQAEFDFSEGAFSPFWDSIEKAARSLGHFDEGVQAIEANLSRYTGLLKKYEKVPPQFPLARKSVEKLGIGTTTAERMQAIVRTAQRNFQFASIYEQRKTNQILVAGFNNLAHALERMTWQITDSIESLSGAIDSMASTLSETTNAIHSRLGDIAESNNQHHGQLMKMASEEASREINALKMLDNIQHRRRPQLI